MPGYGAFDEPFTDPALDVVARYGATYYGSMRQMVAVHGGTSGPINLRNLAHPTQELHTYSGTARPGVTRGVNGRLALQVDASSQAPRCNGSTPAGSSHFLAVCTPTSVSTANTMQGIIKAAFNANGPVWGCAPASGANNIGLRREGASGNVFTGLSCGLSPSVIMAGYQSNTTNAWTWRNGVGATATASAVIPAAGTHYEIGNGSTGAPSVSNLAEIMFFPGWVTLTQAVERYWNLLKWWGEYYGIRF